MHKTYKITLIFLIGILLFSFQNQTKKLFSVTNDKLFLQIHYRGSYWGNKVS